MSVGQCNYAERSGTLGMWSVPAKLLVSCVCCPFFFPLRLVCSLYFFQLLPDVADIVLVVAYGEAGGGGGGERSADAEFKDPSTENPELSNGVSSEAGLSQNWTFCASHTASNSPFLISFSRFFLLRSFRAVFISWCCWWWWWWWCEVFDWYYRHSDIGFRETDIIILKIWSRTRPRALAQNQQTRELISARNT